VDFPIKNGGSFHSYVNVYQRVRSACSFLALWTDLDIGTWWAGRPRFQVDTWTRNPRSHCCQMLNESTTTYLMHITRQRKNHIYTCKIYIYIHLCIIHTLNTYIYIYNLNTFAYTWIVALTRPKSNWPRGRGPGNHQHFPTGSGVHSSSGASTSGPQRAIEGRDMQQLGTFGNDETYKTLYTMG
jgi:hypothetical protein